MTATLPTKERSNISISHFYHCCRATFASTHTDYGGHTRVPWWLIPPITAVVCQWRQRSHPEQKLVAATVPGLFVGTDSASHGLSEVPAAGSAMLLVAPGVIRVLSVPTSLTQNWKTHTHTSMIPPLKWVLRFIHVLETVFPFNNLRE